MNLARLVLKKFVVNKSSQRPRRHLGLEESPRSKNNGRNLLNLGEFKFNISYKHYLVNNKVGS